MKSNLLKISLLFSFALAFSCKKTENTQSLSNPELAFSKDTVINAQVSDVLQITAEVKNNISVSHQWFLNEISIGTEATLNYKIEKAGEYSIKYVATYKGGTQIHTFRVKVDVPVKEATTNSSAYISKVYDFLPAPGQFVNTTIASKESGALILGKNGGMISLGGYGGYVVFGFDHSLKNAAGADIAIKGNPSSQFSEPGIVSVSQDLNGNGLPDDEWYELAGSAYNDPNTIKNYEVTYYNPKQHANVKWKDNQGKSGEVEVNAYHSQNFYPEFASNQESITFKGTLLPSTGSNNNGFFTNAAFDWGYTDSYSTSSIDNYLQNAEFNHLDIDWAVDSEGNKVSLKTVDFVKVSTGQFYTLGWLGEISTEISGAKDLHINN